MIELVPVKIDEAVVLNVSKYCASGRTDCRTCSDIGVAVHNWLISSELGYVIIDLMDEKDICPTFLIELIQLRKRLRIPFLFAGVVEKPRRVLDEHNFTITAYPVFITPEDAIDFMRENHAPLLQGTEMNMVRLGEPLQVARPRLGLRGELEVDGEAEVED